MIEYLLIGIVVFVVGFALGWLLRDAAAERERERLTAENRALSIFLTEAQQQAREALGWRERR